MQNRETHPDSVNLVKPPNTTMPKTLAALPKSQYATTLSLTSGYRDPLEAFEEVLRILELREAPVALCMVVVLFGIVLCSSLLRVDLKSVWYFSQRKGLGFLDFWRHS